MKIIQFTDTHLVPPGETLHKLDPAEMLRRGVAHVLAHHADADLLVITGDLCNDGDPSAYALLREILAPLPCPVRLMLGNHDERPAFRDAFPDQPVTESGHVQSHMDTPQGRLLFLDSHEHGFIGGKFCEARRDWLRDALEGAGDQPVTVFIHHPPAHHGLAHFDHIGLHDTDALLTVLRGHGPGVRHVVFGHIHVPLSGTSPEGLAYSSGQAMSHRFITDLDEPAPWWTGGNPTYRVILIDDHGFRAYGVETDQEPLSRAPVCEGP
ncbi:phosphodiesterase [Salipiger bermudensis]|uniref:phosphodiesterase n=1 Tax=Salipiger bermudensis TaxID=344736 RepID=UPI001CD3BFEE|nr:phosphodiesterase [Salipiger bermudensis]MCA0962529.1 phosphodiesterase [Salipiger bermudensis]